MQVTQRFFFQYQQIAKRGRKYGAELIKTETRTTLINPLMPIVAFMRHSAKILISI